MPSNLPPGFVLDNAAPALPEGFVMDQPMAVSSSPQKPPKTLLGKMWENAKQGGRDLSDFATMDYPAPGQGQYAQILRQKLQAGTADRLDYQRAFLEGMGNSPGGKFLGAAGGLIPEFNIVTTAIKDYINPAIVETTGADESTVALAEMALTAPLMIKAARTPVKGNQLPSIQAAGATTKAITYPIRHPIDAATGTIKAGAKATNAVLRPVVQPVVRGIIDGDNPITGEPGLRTALSSETALEGSRLGKKFGVNFSASELTGNPTAMGIEDALANSARWGGKFADANSIKTERIINGFNKTLDKIYPEASTRTDVGNRLSATYNNTINNLIKTRDEQARIDFEAAVKGAGARDTNILSNNFFRTLQELKDEGNARLLTSREELGAQLANKYLSRLSTKTKAGNTQASTISIYELQKGLANFSKAAKRPGGVLEDAKTAAMRSAYARLAEALQRDLDAEIVNPKGDPQRSAMLALARDNFRNYSNQIADIEKTTIGKIAGGAERNSAGELVLSPEGVADKFIKMEPTEIRNTLQFLDKNNPEVAQMVRRYTLERALMQATEGKGLRGEGTTKDFAKAEFVRQLPDQQKLNALLKDPIAARDVRDVAAAMNRLIDYGAARSNSATAQRTDFLASISRWGKGAFYRAIVSDSLAEDLLNPQKRMAIAKEVRENSPKNTRKGE